MFGPGLGDRSDRFDELARALEEEGLADVRFEVVNTPSWSKRVAVSGRRPS